MSRIGLRSQEPTRLGLGSQETRIGMGYMPTIIIGKGGSKSIEQWMLMSEACEMEIITHNEIVAMCEELWNNPSTADHPSGIIKTINVEKNGGIMEQYWSIPDQIVLKSLSKTEITTMLNSLWTAIIE